MIRFMSMKFEVFFVFVFLLGAASASGVVCTIVDDKVLVEIELDEDVEFFLPEEYSLLEEEDGKASFISKEWIRKDGEWIFALPVIVNGSYDLEVFLPEGFVLMDGLVYPKNYEISSDGRSIILRWENVSEEVVVFYEDAFDSYSWVWLVILILGLGALGLGAFRFQKKRFSKELDRLKKEAKIKSKVSREVLMTRNLFGEEKRIVEFLIKRRECWMKDLVRELGISKVMATRKVRSLVEKGILEKESFGKENRLRLKKN